MCALCDSTGWVCECHGLPWASLSKRDDACDSDAAEPCQCNSDATTERAMTTTHDVSGSKLN